MVFCGKPSKGCGECRSRKIRCDQARPTCSQCVKGNRVCPGYRDELSLMFRDESQQVVRKAKTGATSSTTSTAASRRARKTAHRTASSTGSTSGPQSGKRGRAPAPAPAPGPGSIPTDTDFNNNHDDDTSSSDLQLSPTTVQQLTPPSPSIDFQPSYQFTKDEAVCFFLRFHAWPGVFRMSEGSTEVFNLSGATPSEQAMNACIISVGTAMLSRLRQSTQLKIAAEKEYGHALGLLTSAVADEEEAKSNPTLAAVLLLAIFEVITCRTLRSIEKWTSHIYGAAALLELRGTEQLQDEDGLKLFVQLRFQIIISCLQKGARVPQPVLECSKLAMFLRPQAEAYGDRLISIAGRLSNLRADINAKILTDQKEILSTAYTIEAELMAWIAALPPEFLYTSIEDPNPDLLAQKIGSGPAPYGGRYHIYHDLWLCHTWNQYRCTRIIVSEIILGCLRRIAINSKAAAVSSELQSHCGRLRNTTRQLAMDICCSVPFHFGVGNVATKPLGSVPLGQSYIGGLILLWPLILAGATESKHHPLRNWVIDCLYVIGHSMGIDQALLLIDVLETETGVFDGVQVGEDGVFFRESGGTTEGNKVLTGTWGP
ncbi:Zn(II)2Cys6 transcription factor [Aspergillus melleus]|uniref:Zn(II)2Cys6 transcription factor n=1 Tax=Aspergillus melleus TaxID=138277 RepID=UPI001E8CBD10|nr:uncharacterized protein LDX57_011849 [Aspergillus melleus]KAH8434210.1 hypothetical protein LDX57_011849 [Aspergillus melleus]